MSFPVDEKVTQNLFSGYNECPSNDGEDIFG